VQRFRGLNLILGRGQYLEIRVARRHYVGRFARLRFNSRGRLVYRRPGCLRSGRHVRCPAAALRGEPVENDAVTVVSRPKQVPATIDPSAVQSASPSTLNSGDSGTIWYGGGPDKTPPETAIASGPATVHDAGSVTFSFISNETRATFECMHNLDGWTPCPSGSQSYGSLYVGRHWFAVRAVDEAGNVDPTPALQSWLQNPAPGSHPFVADDDATHYVVPGGSADFQPTGDGWSTGWGQAYEDSFHVMDSWCPGAESHNGATWTMNALPPGTYDVSVLVPGPSSPLAAPARGVQYVFDYPGGHGTATVDQDRPSGWVALGRIHTAASGSSTVRVLDELANGDEPCSVRQVMVDAVQWQYVGLP
jgi:hypothetical protein